MREQAISTLYRSLDVMAANLAYVENELPRLEIESGLRSRLTEFCDNFARDLDRLRTETRAGAKPQDIQEALWAWMQTLHAQVTEVDRIAPENQAYMLLGVLLRESAANIVNAFVEVRDSLRSLSGRGSHGLPDAR